MFIGSGTQSTLKNRTIFPLFIISEPALQSEVSVAPETAEESEEQV